LIGAFFITLVPNLAGGSSIPPDLLFGLVLLVVMLISPSGIVGLGEKILAVLKLVIRSRRKSKDWDPTAELADLTMSEPLSGTETRPKAPADEERTAEADALLEVHDLSAGYGPIKVLRRMNLTVRQGEVTALIGANGAGKSTLLRVISGLVNVDAGDVRFRGESILSHSPYTISRLGIAHVPEGRGIFPDLTVKENLMSARFCAPNHKADIDRGLAVFPQLRRFLGRTAGTLSGGEQQMLAIARAIAARPALVVLDEPSLGLSPKASKDLFVALRQLKENDLTVLLIEQNARAALGLADTCCLVAHGAIVRTGPAHAFEDDDMVATYLGVTR
jgi:branched-chain amino acid transport system ATP-binding protein